MTSDHEDRFLTALGAAVRAARERLGLSQEDVGLEAELHRTYISGVERGVRNLTIKSLLDLAEALETTPSALLRTAEKATGR